MFNTLFLWVVLFVGIQQDVRVTVGDVSMSGSVVYESDMCYYIAVSKLALDTTTGVAMDKTDFEEIVNGRKTEEKFVSNVANPLLIAFLAFTVLVLSVLVLYGKYSYWMAVAKENTEVGGWQEEAEWLREEIKRRDIDRDAAEAEWRAIISQINN